ncbi:MAG: rhomboid family intramembrane serine protease [Candidatus Gastranaerophilales bacterium]|nr:rhomboid family intramembrane serine protease [Candidatus Gastranaerophilales bacterium]
MSRWKDLPIMSIALVSVNVLVFFMCNLTGSQLYDKGMLDLRSVLIEGEYLRILWALFLHGDMGHIFHNMLILFFLGAMIEKEVGHVWYTIFYFLSGIGGNLLSLFYKAWSNDMAGSIGASGAVFGLDGVLLAMVLFSGRRMENVTLPRVFLMIFYSLYSGFTGRNVDNAAHIGGLLTGFVVASFMCLIQRHMKRRHPL